MWFMVCEPVDARPRESSSFISFFTGSISFWQIALSTNVHVTAPGFSTLLIVLLFSNGLIFLYLGILGEYLGQMFLEVKARPSFIIERTINLDQMRGTDEQA